MTDSHEMKINSILIGKVTSIADPEKLGRVKVLLPMGSTHAVTDWAKVATFLVGDKFGSFFIPNVDDMVVVAFNDGNIDCPIVIGRLWNEKDKPPLTIENNDKNHIELIKTKTGNELRLENEKGKEKITLKTEKGEGVILENSKKITISDSSGEDIIIFDTASKAISIKGGMKIEIESKGNKIVIDSSSNKVSIEAGVSLEIKAQTVKIEAGSMMDIKSGGPLNIKGAITKIN
jgi:uncharacterized protein involved in type VI secretion and phage assembly